AQFRDADAVRGDDTGFARARWARLEGLGVAEQAGFVHCCRSVVDALIGVDATLRHAAPGSASARQQWVTACNNGTAHDLILLKCRASGRVILAPHPSSVSHL